MATDQDHTQIFQFIPIVLTSWLIQANCSFQQSAYRSCATTSIRPFWQEISQEKWKIIKKLQLVPLPFVDLCYKILDEKVSATIEFFLSPGTPEKRLKIQ